jgi:hypothetical protein
VSINSVLEELVNVFEGDDSNLRKPYSYFARAIRGGRGNLENCRVIVSEMEKYSTVLSKHVVLDEIDRFESEWKKRFPKISVYQRDMKMIEMSKYFVGDITVESTGVGAEICVAKCIRKIPTALFCHEKAKGRPTVQLYLGNRRMKLTLEELLNLHGVNIPIFYYNDQNIKEIAEREIRNFFTEYSSKV